MRQARDDDGDPFADQQESMGLAACGALLALALVIAGSWAALHLLIGCAAPPPPAEDRNQ